VWLIVRYAKPRILAMDADRCWQAPFAAVGSLLPGASFLSIAAFGLTVGTSSNCLQFTTGRAIFAVLLFLTTFALARATWIAAARSREAATIRRSSSDAGKRLKAASPAMYPVREIADTNPFCAVLGILNPVIVVSTGALARLDDEELRAALCHEAAHVRRYDHVLGALAAFFSDLLPFAGADLLQTYWEAREFAADQRAVVQSNVEALAGAIIAMAKPPRLGLAALDGGTVSARLQRLLTPSVQSASSVGRMIAGSALGVAAMIAVLPIAAGALGFVSCHLQ
jgi:Zn-dependent protease with chaperone function